MKYDLTKHALIEDNGDLVATFNPCIPAGRAFKILDDLNNTSLLLGELQEAKGWEYEYDSIKKELELSAKGWEYEYDSIKKEIWDLEEEHKELDDRLQSIITMLENSSEDYSKEELIKEVIDICAAPL